MLSNLARHWLLSLLEKLVSTTSFKEKKLFCKKHILTYWFSPQRTKCKKDPEMSYELEPAAPTLWNEVCVGVWGAHAAGRPP